MESFGNPRISGGIARRFSPEYNQERPSKRLNITYDMILISDTTHNTYDSDTVEVWTYNMSLKFTIEKSVVLTYSEHYEIVSLSTGEHIATFPISETVFIIKSPETQTQITQNA